MLLRGTQRASAKISLNIKKKKKKKITDQALQYSRYQHENFNKTKKAT
jgi:hypothetical protein